MTGFLIIVRGFSFRKESTMAVFRIFVSVSAFDFTWDARSMISLKGDPQNALPESISRCSRMGPRLKAGKKVSAPTIKMVQISRTLKSGPVTGKVPSEAGVIFFRARFPAIARIGITTKNLPNSRAMAVLALYQV